MRGARRSLAMLLAVGLVVSGCAFEYQTRDFDLEIPESAESSYIYDAQGRQITLLRTPEHRIYKRVDEIPDVMKNAVIAIEDERFYHHEGVDLRALIRSARSNISAGGVAEGASTITQQYVGGVFLDRTERTMQRKLQEIALARRFEDNYTKDFVLEQYLNWVYLGNGANGVQAAAHGYFGKDVEDLTLPEAALIAGLVQRPSELNPLRNEQGARQRRNVVLDQMLANEYITEEEHQEAVNAPVELADQEPITEEAHPAGHFVEEVKSWFLSNPEFGETREERLRLLFEGGLRIETTLDLDVQAAAEAARNAVLPDEPAELEAAVVVMDPSNGDVVAMVGGKDFFGDHDAAKVNLAMGEGRQAGSAMKTVGLAAALDAGRSVNERYPAPSRTTIELPGPGPTQTWEVRGVAGGNATLTEATVRSMNTAYAHLIDDIGPERLVDMAERLGIQTPIAPVYAAVLGSENTTSLDLATAYSTLASRGVRHDPVFVTRIINPDGTTLYEHRYSQTKALDTDIADHITNILAQAVERGTGTNARLDRPVAGKTGSAQNNADATFVGYTPQYTTAVWVGFPRGQVPMEPPTTPIRVFGGTYPAQIFRHAMETIHEGLPEVPFPEPPPIPDRPTSTTEPDQEAVTVPNVHGQTAMEAENTLRAAGFSVTTARVTHGEAPPGTVINQAPRADSAAPRGTTVTIEIAAEPEHPTVPDVIGLERSDARNHLIAAGYQVNEVVQPAPDNASINPEPGQVWDQSPPPAAEHAEDSVVEILIQPDD